MSFGDTLIFFVTLKVCNAFALFLKGVTEEEETKEDSNDGKGGCGGDINQMTKRLNLNNRK